MKIKKYSVDVISPGAITPYSRDSDSAGAGNLELDTRSLATSITDSYLYAGNPCMSVSTVYCYLLFPGWIKNVYVSLLARVVVLLYQSSRPWLQRDPCASSCSSQFQRVQCWGGGWILCTYKQRSLFRFSHTIIDNKCIFVSYFKFSPMVCNTDNIISLSRISWSRDVIGVVEDRGWLADW